MICNCKTIRYGILLLAVWVLVAVGVSLHQRIFKRDASPLKGFSLVEDKLTVMLREAEALKAEGRPAEAVSAYEKIIKERPDFAEGYFRLGALYFSLGIKGKAEEYYLQAIAHDFKNPEIYFHLGYIKESQGKLQDALERYLQAEEKGVANAELYYNIGNVFAQLGSLPKAADYYKKVLGVNPKHMDACVNLSIVLFQQAQYPDAKLYLDKAVALGYKAPPQFVEELKKY